MRSLLKRTSRRRTAQPRVLPPPVGGLNGRDSLANMPEMDAFMLDNWVVRSTSVDVRRGYVKYVDPLAGAVKSLEVYEGGAASAMLAFASGEVLDVSNGDPVPAALLSGRNSDEISSCMFSNAGNQYLLCYSGADEPFSFDGTTATPLVITGAGDQNTIFQGFPFKGRLYLAQAGLLGFYYLAVGAIQGAASYFDLSQVAKSGGRLAAIASFSQGDAGSGPDDFIVFVTTKGEYLVYGGTDPSNAATFGLVGRYYAAPPIGRKGVFNFRSDLYFITEEGLLSMSDIRTSSGDANENESLTYKLGKYLSDLNTFKDTYGWCAVSHAKTNLLLLNCPVSAGITGAYYQFALNTTTINRRAWSRFKGIDAICWASFNGGLYFGTKDGRIMQAEVGGLDDGRSIQVDARQAYNYFDDKYGAGDADKHFHFATFVLDTNGRPPVSAQLNVNFENDPPSFVGNLAEGVGSLWDVAEWDVGEWADESAVQNFTVSLDKLGYAGSIWLRANITDTTLSWSATRITFSKTGSIVLL